MSSVPASCLLGWPLGLKTLVISLLSPDIYAIGVGELDVDWRELNELGSKKDGEKHAFKLADAQALRQVFEHMLGAGTRALPLRWGTGEETAGAQAGTPSLTCLLPDPVLASTDVSMLTDTICGVGNMSANASNQERTPWHVTIKVQEGGLLGPRGERSSEAETPPPLSLPVPHSPGARRPVAGPSSRTSGC